jgi:uncharacterized protein (DUF2236 family)
MPIAERSLRLPWPIGQLAERQVDAFLYASPKDKALFSEPAGEPGFVPLDGVNARVYASPLTLYIGGMSAVLLELAEPRVRHGVWDHSVFPVDPVRRLQRTGLAAMVTFYSARSVASAMIEGINRRHTLVAGRTPNGEPYQADDPSLLLWVQATAAYGFLEAFARFGPGLTEPEWDNALLEAVPVAKAYGVPNPPERKKDVDRLLAEWTPRLGPSDIQDQFLAKMRVAAVLPRPFTSLQPLFIRAAVDMLPEAIREQLGLSGHGLSAAQRRLLRAAVGASLKVHLGNHPRTLAERRIGIFANEAIPSSPS